MDHGRVVERSYERMERMITSTTDDPPQASAHSVLQPGETVERVDRRTVTVRRSPRYFRFMFTGAVLGVLGALVLTLVFPPQSDFTTWQVFGFLLLGFSCLGIGFGAGVAVVLDWITGRRSPTLEADRVRLRVP